MALLPPFYLKTVVSIELAKKENEFQPIATGFLIGFYSGMNEKNDKLYKVFLVTNRHVFNGQESVWLRFNKGNGSQRYKLLLQNGKQPLWSTHQNPNVDIAIIQIDVNQLQNDGIDFQIIPDEMFAYAKNIKELGITQGDEIFVLGFPLGLGGRERNYTIVRSGIISRLDDEIIRDTNTFLIDASVFPGNSGGPVILKPATSSIIGTPTINKSYLLGVISGYRFYDQKAYTLDDLINPRIIFRENTGLAAVVPLDYVLDIVNHNV